jgi:hypothetical protein
MNRLIAAACLFMTACAPQAPKADDQLAPARAGKLVCVLPVESEKLCNTLVTLTFRPDGSVSHHSDILMGDQPRIVLSTDYPVKLKDGAFCGAIGPADVDAARIVVDGAPAPPEQADQIRTVMKANIAARNMQEGCVKPVLRNGGLVMTGIFDGVDTGSADRMIWVGPNEGYAVR